jgi:hypothetical protein
MWRDNIMAKMATIIIVKDTEPVNTICLDQSNVSNWMENYDGTCVVLDPEDDFGVDFVTLTGCVAVDVTGVDPMPGVGNGWLFVDGGWVAPVVASVAKS